MKTFSSQNQVHKKIIPFSNTCLPIAGKRSTKNVKNIKLTQLSNLIPPMLSIYRIDNHLAYHILETTMTVLMFCSYYFKDSQPRHFVQYKSNFVLSLFISFFCQNHSFCSYRIVLMKKRVYLPSIVTVLRLTL